MNGYQPEKRCSKCLRFYTCNKKHRNRVCRKYKECKPNPPKAGTTPSLNSQTPTYTPLPMPEVKPPKQRTVLSVRDFALLYNIANYEMARIEVQAENTSRVYSDDSMIYVTDEENKKRILQESLKYQDLLRICNKLGELNIVVETPSVEVEE